MKNDSVFRSVIQGWGVAALLIGMKAEDAIKCLEGIDCNGRGTSCPDQVAKALRAAIGG